jgi:hypothetical protein
VQAIGACFARLVPRRVRPCSVRATLPRTRIAITPVVAARRRPRDNGMSQGRHHHQWCSLHWCCPGQTVLRCIALVRRSLSRACYPTSQFLRHDSVLWPPMLASLVVAPWGFWSRLHGHRRVARWSRALSVHSLAAGVASFMGLLRCRRFMRAYCCSLVKRFAICARGAVVMLSLSLETAHSQRPVN